jgi:hypothetical protein
MTQIATRSGVDAEAIRHVVDRIVPILARYQGVTIDETDCKLYAQSCRSLAQPYNPKGLNELEIKIRRECKFRPTPKEVEEWADEIAGRHIAANEAAARRVVTAPLAIEAHPEETERARERFRQKFRDLMAGKRMP